MVFTSSYDKTKRRRYSTCNGCGKNFGTNEYRRLYSHLKSCPDIEPETKNLIASAHRERKLDSDKKKMKIDNLNTDLALLFAENNLPFKLLDSQLFQKLIIQPHYQKLPTRQLLSTKYMSDLARTSDTNFLKSIDIYGDYCLCIEFDHWSDSCHRPIFGMVATSPSNQKHLVTLEDISMKSHSTQHIIDSLQSSLENWPPYKINSIVSDSAASCKLARQNFVDDKRFSHIIQHRCYAHFLNLIGQEFTKQNYLKEMMHWAHRLSVIIRNNTRLSAIIRDSGKRKVVRSTETRWYSTVNMIESELDVADIVLDFLDNNRSNNKSNEDEVRILDHRNTIYEMKAAVKILRPLANCIGLAERNDTNLSTLFKGILVFLRSILETNEGNPYISEIVKAFFKYMDANKLGNDLDYLITGYIVDRKNKLDYMTDDAQDIALRTLIRIAKISGYLNEYDNEESLAKQFISYMQQEGHYGRFQKDDESAYHWWKQQPPTILRSVAMRISLLRSSSANIERMFSDAKRMQYPHRGSFHLETLSDLIKVKYSRDSLITDRELLNSSDDEHDITSLIRVPRIQRHRSLDYETAVSMDSIDNIGSQSSTITRISDYSDYEQLTSSQRNDFDGLLDPKIDRAIESFRKLVDFTIINEFIFEQDHNSQFIRSEEPNYDVAFNILRQARYDKQNKNK